MKKLFLIILVLSLAICFSACTGGGGEIQYNDGYNEYQQDNSSNNPVDLNSSTSSTTAPSTDTAASTVLIPLTTSVGGTVPTVLTTSQNVTVPTVDYTPVTIPTTVPPVQTSYVSPTSSYHSPNTDKTTKKPSNNTSEEKTTEAKTSYVSVASSDTDISIDTEGNVIILCVSGDDFGSKMKKTSGNATVTINGGSQYKATFSVAEKLDVDGNIVITIKPKEEIVYVTEDEVTVTIPKGSLVSTKNISNNKFTSQIGYV